jgi:hypothetical protein
MLSAAPLDFRSPLFARICLVYASLNKFLNVIFLRAFEKTFDSELEFSLTLVSIQAIKRYGCKQPQQNRIRYAQIIEPQRREGAQFRKADG